MLIIAEEADGFSSKSDIEEQCIYDRLHAPQNMCWGDNLCVSQGSEMNLWLAVA